MNRKHLFVTLLIAVVAAGLLVGYAFAKPKEPERPEHMQQLEVMAEMIEWMENVCFEPSTAALIAIGGLKDEVEREPKAVAKDLEGVLENTATLGLRNAIRMTLKDVYKAQGEKEKLLAHLRALIAENDKALEEEEEEEEDMRAQNISRALWVPIVLLGGFLGAILYAIVRNADTRVKPAGRARA